jgi:hypothetical protein
MRETPTIQTTPSFQTVRLRRGRHVSPEHGVCVMELASMLAGERFTDRPRSVSPVIAAFLRTYNDLVDDARRQDLYRFAADSVGTRSSRAIEQMRAAWLPSDAHLSAHERWALRLSVPGHRRVVRASQVARHLAEDPVRHGEALNTVEALIALGTEPPGVEAEAAACTPTRTLSWR